MGQLISRQHNNNSNDALINALIKRDFIQTMDVEKVFRSVDRGLYFTNDEKRNAYRDSAWQSDKIHLSAPCVYATVLECLELKPGNTFLNIGSGIGYFSTLAGLLLGVNGINHGIEIHQLLIDCAHQKLEEFKLNSAAIDYYHFCEPVFIQGNVCEMSTMGFYDRVYCGAGVPVEESQFMMSLIKIGGILVMPLNGSLVKITRKDEHTWKTVEVLEVSFTNLVIPENFCGVNKIKFPPVEPLTLQELCRSSIRSLLRENLKNISPNLPMRTLCSSNNVLDTKNLNRDIPLNQFVRIQYGVSEEGLVSLRHIVDSIAGLNDDDDSMPGPGFMFTGIYDDNDDDDDDNDDDDDDDDEDDEEEEEVVEAEEVVEEHVDNELEKDFDEEVEYKDGDDNDDSNAATDSICTKPHNCEKEFEEILRMENELMNRNQQNKNTAQTSDESTKRKSPEAGCSEQNKTLTGTATEAENPKRMKLNKSPEKMESVPSPSPDGSDLWDTVSIDPSVQEEDTNSWVSSMDADVNDVDEDDDSLGPRGIYNSLLNGDSSDESDTDSETAGQMKKYCFISERKENELSKLLKGKVNSLPIPIPLKTFLNYNLVD